MYWCLTRTGLYLSVNVILHIFLYNKKILKYEVL